jgi:hypothetical protein
MVVASCWKTFILFVCCLMNGLLDLLINHWFVHNVKLKIKRKEKGKRKEKENQISAQPPSLAQLGRPSRPLSPLSFPPSAHRGQPNQQRAPAQLPRPTPAPAAAQRRAPSRARARLQPRGPVRLPRPPSPARVERQRPPLPARARASASRCALCVFPNRLREIPVQQPPTTPKISREKTCAPRPVSRFDFAVSPNRPGAASHPKRRRRSRARLPHSLRSTSLGLATAPPSSRPRGKPSSSPSPSSRSSMSQRA